MSKAVNGLALGNRAQQSSFVGSWCGKDTHAIERGAEQRRQRHGPSYPRRAGFLSRAVITTRAATTRQEPWYPLSARPGASPLRG